jgi:hypothetical protein
LDFPHLILFVSASDQRSLVRKEQSIATTGWFHKRRQLAIDIQHHDLIVGLVREEYVPFSVDSGSFCKLESVGNALDFCGGGFEHALAANWGNDGARNCQAKKC